MGISGVRGFQAIQHPWPQPAWHWRLQRMIAGRARRIVVPSASVAAAAERLSGISPDKVVIIPNGVDAETFAGLGRFGSAPRRIVFLGRLDPIKRIGDLLGAVAKLEGMVRLEIYGEGPERQRIGKEIEIRKIGEWVALRGAVADPREALRDAAVLVLPSEAEGFGLVLLEAMAAGVAIVATDAPGIRDVLKNGKTGLLVPVGDIEALATAIGRICSDESLWQSLVEGGLNCVRASYDWESILPAYRKLLELD